MRDRGRRAVTLVCLFVVGDLPAVRFLLSILDTRLALVWTGYRGTILGYDLLFFPAFLVVTGLALFGLARVLRVLPTHDLVLCLVVFSLLRTALAYLYWFNLEIPQFVFARLLGLDLWPWFYRLTGWTKAGAVVGLELMLLMLVFLIFLKRKTDLDRPDGEGATPSAGS